MCLAVAVAAVKVGRSVRLNLERHTDIAITGHRHPFKIKYNVGFTNKGRLLGLDVQMWSDAGLYTRCISSCDGNVFASYG
jgi:xanthine dehydrogenase large subunit